MEEKLGEVKIWLSFYVQWGSYIVYMLKGESSFFEQFIIYLEKWKLKGNVKCYLKVRGVEQ